MATTSTTGYTGTVPTTAQQNTIPNTTQKLAAPGTTVQPVSAFQGGNQTPTPTGQVMDPLAFSAPAGFTQGTGAMAGATYYQGSKVIGYDNSGNPMLENGQTVQGAGPALQAWTNSPQFNQAEAVGLNSQPVTNAPSVQTYLDSTASDRAIQDAWQAKLRADPNYQLTAEDSAASNRLNASWTPFYQQAQAQGAALGMTPGGGSGYYDANGTWIDPSKTPAEYLIGGLRVDANGNAVTGPNAYNALSEMYRGSGRTPGAIDSTIMDMLNQNPALMANLPQDQYDALARTLAATQPGFVIPPRASDTGAGGQTPINMPALTGPQTGGTGGGTGATGGSGTGSTTGQGSGLAPNVSPVNPNSDLRNMQITPGDLLDRFALAQQQYGTFANATNPQYEAALRDATRSAAGAGRLGSGMLRTSYGDLANQRTQALQNERDTLFQNALLGSVQDAQTKFSDLLAEQQYQTGAQNQAFNQAMSAQQLQELLTSGAFSRALQMFNAGQAGNPAATQLNLAQIWANQANAQNQGLGLMMQGLAGSGANSSSDALLANQIYQQAVNAGIFDPVSVPPDATGISTVMPGVQTIGSY